METQVITKQYHQEVIQRVAKLDKYLHYARNQKLDFVFLHFPEYKETDQDALLDDLDLLWPVIN
jgi:hypothetical protein